MPAHSRGSPPHAADFCCNGTVVEDPELGQVIQLQGDQRKNVLQASARPPAGLPPPFARRPAWLAPRSPAFNSPPAPAPPQFLIENKLVTKDRVKVHGF